MRAKELTWSPSAGWTGDQSGKDAVDLVLYFGARRALADRSRFTELRALFPSAHVLGCSTGGQIHNDDVVDEEIAAIAIRFDTTKLKLACRSVDGVDASSRCGVAIGHALEGDGLAGIFVLSDGLVVNGSELVAGITSVVGHDIPLTGGLAGDGAEFGETLVGADDAPHPHRVAAIGFYGPAIRIGHGSAGGWDVFGPRRRITKSMGNLLLELDGEPALDLYERYLGEEAQNLPGSALLFPLQISNPHHPDINIVRTVLAVDRKKRTMTFAGDMPEGWTAQLMRGNFDRLCGGAADAARQAQSGIGDGDSVAILVSCIGRRLLMGQRITDEIEAAGAVLGKKTLRLGFYSYGEISPHAASGTCELHNQTMTVTAFHEAA
ncbi:MAG TPA: FIST N-terminal domain-containing protein [Rhodocyclaceae bacterium]|nr:FIST N-terminal domain-containing protein [Rhodocyclaceae bacterium]